MKKFFLLPVLTITLSACTLMGEPATYTLSRQPLGMALNSSGTVTIIKSMGMVKTTATVVGLAPNTYYVGHYHLQGTAATDPCTSGGAPVMSSKAVSMSDALGNLTLSGSVNSSDVASATYFNIHTAKDATGAPADPGVTCTAVKM